MSTAYRRKNTQRSQEEEEQDQRFRNLNASYKFLMENDPCMTTSTAFEIAYACTFENDEQEEAVLSSPPPQQTSTPSRHRSKRARSPSPQPRRRGQPEHKRQKKRLRKVSQSPPDIYSLKKDFSTSIMLPNDGFSLDSDPPGYIRILPLSADWDDKPESISSCSTPPLSPYRQRIDSVESIQSVESKSTDTKEVASGGSNIGTVSGANNPAKKKVIATASFSFFNTKFEMCVTKNELSSDHDLDLNLD